MKTRRIVATALVLLLVAAGAVLWLRDTAHGVAPFSSSPESAEAPQSTDSGALPSERKPAVERRTARVRCMREDGRPWLHLALDIEGGARAGLHRGSTDADGEVRFEIEGAPSALSLRGTAFHPADARLVRESASELDYGEVSLRPAAHLTVLIRSLPTDASSSVRAQVVYLGADPSRPPIAGPALEVEPLDGAAALALVVDAERELYVVARGAGFSRSTRARPVRLEAGESRELPLDVQAGCRVSGRLVGIPGGAAAGRRIELHTFEPATPKDGERIALPGRIVERSTVTNAQGRFEFLGLDAGIGELFVDLGARRAVLTTDAAIGFGTCELPEIEVHPLRALVGIGLDPALLSGHPAFECALSLDREPLGPLSHPAENYVLVERAELEGAQRLNVFVVDLGWASLDDPLGRVDGDGRLLLGARDFTAAAGRLLVEVRGALDAKTHVACVPIDDAAGPVRFAQRADRDRAVRATRSDSGFVFDGLPRGRYQLRWERGAETLVALDSIQVDGERSVTLDAPLRLTRQGRVEGWDEIPDEWRPIAFRHAGDQTAVRDGRFLYDGFAPVPQHVAVELRGYLVPRAEAELDASGEELVLRLVRDQDRLCRLHVEPLFGGRIVAEVARESAHRTSYDRPLIPLQPADDGDPRVPCGVGESTRGRVYEITPSAPVLRGWFEIPPGTESWSPRCDGRFVTVHFAVPERLVTLSAGLANDIGSPVPLTSASSDIDIVVWLPLEADALVVEYANENSQRLPIGPGTASITVP